MQLFGKVVIPKRGYDLNTNPEILVNIKGSKINLSKGVTNELGEDFFLGFGYDPEQSLGAKAAIFVHPDAGVKVGKKGVAGSKWHADELKKAFISEQGMEESTTRFKLNVDMVNPIEHEGYTLYKVTFGEVLPDLTRTVSKPISGEDTNITSDASVDEEILENVTEDVVEETTDQLV